MPLFARLEHICLTYCVNLRDAGVMAVAQNVRELRSIQFRLKPGITNACLLPSVEHQYRTLEIVVVFETLDCRWPVNVVQHEFQTSHFDADWFRRVFDRQRWISGFADHVEKELLPRIVCADKVTTLSLSCVDEDILATVAQCCPQLKVLDLSRADFNEIYFCPNNMFWK